MSAFILEYEYRSDNGPHLVGPFDTRDAAADSWSYEIKPGEFTDTWTAIDAPTGTIFDGLIGTLP